MPELFQSIPLRWRDGGGGLLVTAITLCLGIVALLAIARPLLAIRP